MLSAHRDTCRRDSTSPRAREEHRRRPAAEVVAFVDVGTSIGVDTDGDEPLLDERHDIGMRVRRAVHRGALVRPRRDERQQNRLALRLCGTGKCARPTTRATLCSQPSNYNDRVVALRYVYVLALSIWFGGIITIGAHRRRRSRRPVQRRFFLTLVRLRRPGADDACSGWRCLARARRDSSPGSPSRSAMFARHALRGPRSFERLSINLLAPIAVGGLALLFWEARDGTRAA